MPHDPGQTRLRILEAGAELFYGQSVAEAGVEAIAGRACVTKKTLYYHFESKTNLIRETFAYRAQEALKRYELTLEAAPTAEKAIFTLFEQLHQFARLTTTKGCPFIRGAAELAAKGDHPASGVIRDLKTRFSEILSRKLYEDGFSQSGMLARQILIVYEGATINIMFHNDPNYTEDSLTAVRAILKAAGR